MSLMFTSGVTYLITANVDYKGIKLLSCKSVSTMYTVGLVRNVDITETK